MAKLLHRFAMLLVALLLAAPVAGKVTGSRYDKNADFSKYKTFRWVDNPKPRGPRVQPGADLDVLIRDLVTQHLTSTGLEEAKELSDRCALMLEGKLSCDGPFEQVEAAIRSAFEQEAATEEEEFRRLFPHLAGGEQR